MTEPSWAGAGIDSFAAIAPQRTDSEPECRGCTEYGPIEHEHETPEPEPGPGEIADCG